MQVRQLIVLGIALLAAVGALVFVQGVARSRPTAEAPVEQTGGPRVLVAAREIEAGTRLAAGDLEWRTWTKDAVAESFVTDAAAADADTRFIEEGRVARVTMLAGEPIVEPRLVKPGDQGFMAAILSPGLRAVAVPISEETAASGFILPNDRVDVVMTRKVAGANGGAEVTRSGIVFENVRVLAIDQARKPETEGEAMKGSVALLELSPRDTELLAMADQMGEISLALRPVLNEKAGASAARASASVFQQDFRSGRDVKVHSFGSVSLSDPSQGTQP